MHSSKPRLCCSHTALHYTGQCGDPLTVHSTYISISIVIHSTALHVTALHCTYISMSAVIHSSKPRLLRGILGLAFSDPLSTCAQHTHQHDRSAVMHASKPRLCCTHTALHYTGQFRHKSISTVMHLLTQIVLCMSLSQRV